MNKQEVYDYLTNHGIDYHVVEHGAVYNMEELAKLELPHGDVIAKNLFLRDDKHNYYLITVKGDKRVDLKEFRRDNGTRRLSFADEKDMMDVLSLTPGSVTPLGLLNDKEHKVIFFLDGEFLTHPALIGMHPNDNTATVWLKTEELIAIIKEHGNEVRTFLNKEV